MLHKKQYCVETKYYIYYDETYDIRTNKMNQIYNVDLEQSQQDMSLESKKLYDKVYDKVLPL